MGGAVIDKTKMVIAVLYSGSGDVFLCGLYIVIIQWEKSCRKCGVNSGNIL